MTRADKNVANRFLQWARILLVFMVACAVSVAHFSTNLHAGERQRSRDIPIPAAFFGMHIHHLATTTPWPDMRFGTWRLWDAYVAWPNLEPQQDKWDFTALDKYVAAAEHNHVEVLLPLGLSPQWASSRPTEKSGYAPGNAAPPAHLEDWQQYVRAVATRYKGRIHYYEIWNEPNLSQFYTGPTPELVQLAKVAFTTLKEIDPTVVVCSPSATNADGAKWLDQYLQYGGGNYADVIGFHFYVNPNPPEEMVPLIQKVEAVMQKNGIDKQLWNTESGWAIQGKQSVVNPAPGKGFNSIVLSEEQASAYLARAYILSWANGISRFYWYSWDNKTMGLAEADGKTAKAPAKAYGELENWLIGARMGACQPDESGNWTCEITRDNIYHGWLLWNPNRTLEFRVPSNWGVRQERNLLAGPLKITSNQSVQIGQIPILLENRIP